MKLRFSIRDLLWLVLVIGLALGWWTDHHHRQYEFHRVRTVNETDMLEDRTSGKSWVREGDSWVEAKYQ